MKRLILLRHAKTEPWYEGVDDHGRALLPRGTADPERMAVRLAEAGYKVDRLIVSTARRARETCSAMEPVLKTADRRFEDDLYLAGVSGLESIVSDHDGVGTLMLIGHNPGIHDFACGILRIAGSADDQAALRLSEKFPTGCAAIFESEDDGAFVQAAFRLVDVMRPKDDRPDVWS